MNTQKQVFKKLFKEDLENHKIELASQKVELSLLSDFEKNFNSVLDDLNKTEPEYNKIKQSAKVLYSDLEKVNTKTEDVISEFNKLEKISNDLGLKLDSNTLGKRGRLQNILRTIETVKSELKRIV